MKNSVKIFLLTLIILCGCGTTTTLVTSSWRKTNATANNYKNIFVAAITSNVSAKEAVENGLQAQLQEKGITVEKSIDVFPPNFSNQTNLQKALVMGQIQATHADGILTIALLRQETETHYVPGGVWNPGLRYGYYNNFWNYYNNWYPYVYAPGYYDQQKVYYLETNLYDAKTEDLIWAAQSKTYDPVNIDSFLKGYLKSIYQQMIKDGLISANSRMAQ